MGSKNGMYDNARSAAQSGLVARAAVAVGASTTFTSILQKFSILHNEGSIIPAGGDADIHWLSVGDGVMLFSADGEKWRERTVSGNFASAYVSSQGYFYCHGDFCAAAIRHDGTYDARITTTAAANAYSYNNRIWVCAQVGDKGAVFAVGNTWEEMFRTTDVSRLTGITRISGSKFCALGSSVGKGAVYFFDTGDSSYAET
jgi:hypothetical protein